MSAGILLYAGAIGLVLIGIYAMIAQHNLMRAILGLVIVESGVNLFLVATGFRNDAAAPIIEPGVTMAMVDPLPQALVLTAIVIGFGVLALALALLVKVHQTSGTLDTREIARSLAQDPAGPAAGASVPSVVNKGTAS